MADPISTTISVAKQIVEKIAPFGEDQIKLLWGLNEELTKLGDLVSQIAAVQLDAEGGKYDNKTTNLLEKLKDIMEEANRLMDYFSPRVKSKNNRPNEDGCYSYFVSDPNPLVWIKDSFKAKKFKSINDRLSALIKNNNDISLPIQNPKSSSHHGLVAPAPEDIGSVLSWKFASACMTTIYIKNCPPGKHLPPFHHLPSLENLSFESVMVDYIDTTTTDDEDNEDGNGNSKSSSQLFFPSLKQLWIWYCPNLKGWWKKKKDDDGTELPPLFPCISMVHIRESPNMTWMPLFPTVSDRLYIETGSIIPLDHTKQVCSAFKFLKNLWISQVPELEYMEIELFQSLEYLWVKNCRNLRDWGTKGGDGEASKVATSVTKFEIINCPKLKSLPQGMQLLSSSAKFIITGCPLLKQRYPTKSGQDWPESNDISTDW